MRKSLLLIAAIPLVLAPPALAASDGHEGAAEPSESVCRVPDIDLDYDTQTFAAVVTLPVSGCHSREHREFVLSASIGRIDSSGARDLVERSVMCGPFRSADDVGPDQEPPRYSCTVAVWLDHPDVETAQYDIDVSYPGAAQQRIDRVFTFCTSDRETASCEQ